MSLTLKPRNATSQPAQTAAMPAPPVRSYSFTSWSTNNPSTPQPGNQLDSNFDQTNNSVQGLIAWASTSLNTDGTIRDASLDESNFVPGVFDDIAQDAIEQVQPLVDQAISAAGAANTAANAADNSSVVAGQHASDAGGSAVTATNQATLATDAADAAAVSAGDAGSWSTEAENAANHASGSQALSESYAVVCEAWAEHMPDTIPPNILAVMGITGDHWSSRWWANQAAIEVSDAVDNLDGALNDALDQIDAAGQYWLGVLQAATKAALIGIQSLYLGAFVAPPITDSFGNPIATGAMYFDLTLDAAYVWNGVAWRPLVKPGPSAIFRYIYVATAGQTVFSGPDRSGSTLVYDSANYQTISVFKKGLLLTPTDDYTEAVNRITLHTGAAAGDIVQLQVETVPVVTIDWNTVQLDTSVWGPGGGILQDVNGHPLVPNAPSDVMVSVDGVWQQGGVDYAITGDILTFTKNLVTGAKTFGLVIIPTQSTSVPVPGLKVIDTSTWVFDGTAVAFPLKDQAGIAVVPETNVNLLVSLNGVWQAATRDYSVTASTVTFVVPPEPFAIAFAVAGLPAFMTTG